MASLLRCLRFYHWFYLTGLTVLGMLYCRLPLSAAQFVLALAVGALYLGHGYTLNDYFDLRSAGQGSPQLLRAKRTAALVLLAANIVLSLLIGPVVLAMVLAGSIAGYLYVAPPFRLKNVLPANFLLNSFGFSLLFLIGTAAGGGPVTGHLAAAFFFFALFLPLQIVHHISHARCDATSGAENLLNRCGTKRTLLLLHLALALVFAASLLVPVRGHGKPWLAGAAFLLCAALAGLAQALRSGKDFTPEHGRTLRSRSRALTLLFGIIAGIIFAAA